MNPSVYRALVVVPAHNEEGNITRCLRALKAAARDAAVPVEILVVCDACRDNTENLVTAENVPILRTAAGSVGVARRSGIEKLLRHEKNPCHVWIANTDADSIVPQSWLRDQLALAQLGADAVAGMVSLTRTGRSDLFGAFEAQYRQRVGRSGMHPHVHGANLGVRASAYLDVGGFPPLSNHEDVLLVRALQQAGYDVTSPGWLTVETSARLIGRCDQGFAADLSRLQQRSSGERVSTAKVGSKYHHDTSACLLPSGHYDDGVEGGVRCVRNDYAGCDA